MDASGLVVPISVWMQKIKSEQPRCLVVMEPVERTTAKVTFDSTVSFQISVSSQSKEYCKFKKDCASLIFAIFSIKRRMQN